MTNDKIRPQWLTDPSGSNLPQAARGIKIGRKCRRLHFLQGTGWWGWSAPKGAEVARCVLRYADNTTEELPVLQGQDIGPWWTMACPALPENPADALVVWSGKNRTNFKDGCSLYLYKSSRDNPHPDKELRSIDLMSAVSDASLIVVGLTVE